MKINRDHNILILFAPVFLEFACDIVKSLEKKYPNICITAFCMGGKRTIRYVEKNLPKRIIKKIIDFEDEERKWLNEEQLNLDYIASFCNHFGDDFFNRTIIADRRLGKSFVSGGLVRPNTIADLLKKHSEDLHYKYVQGALKFLDNLFKKVSFDFVFLYAVAGAPAILLSFFSEMYNVKIRRFQHTRIQDRVHLDASFKGSLSLIRNKYYEQDSLSSKVAKDQALKYLNEFRYNPEIPEYSRFNNKIKSLPFKKFSLFFIYFFAFYFRIFLRKSIKEKLSRDKLRHKWFYFCRSFFSKASLSGFSIEMPKGKYVYFPLHVDPEASTMVLAPFHTNQLIIIENIAKSLPVGYTLIVKEHIPMIGFRPKDFYKKIKSFPRVKLIHPSFDQFTLIKKASIVSVITGTAGFEALMLSKKVLLFEKDTPFSCLDQGLIVESDLSKLCQRFKQLEKMSPIQEDSLLKYIGLIFQESFSMNTSILWGDYSKVPNNEKQAIVDKIAVQWYQMIKDEKNE